MHDQELGCWQKRLWLGESPAALAPMAGPLNALKGPTACKTSQLADVCFTRTAAGTGSRGRTGTAVRFTGGTVS